MLPFFNSSLSCLAAALREMVRLGLWWAQGWGKAHLEVLPPALYDERLSLALLHVTKGKHRGMTLGLSGGMAQSSGPPIVAELTSLWPDHLAPISLPDTSSKYGGIQLTDPIACPNPPLAGVGLAQPAASPPEAGDLAGQREVMLGIAAHSHAACARWCCHVSLASLSS